jgi:hypothetical protein
MRFDYSIVVVIYGTNLSDSITLRSLMDIGKAQLNFKLIVWDNSPKTATLSEIEWLKLIQVPFEYVNTPENISLAKVYNKAVLKSNDAAFLVIFDQDSSFDKVFFQKAQFCIHSNPDINLFLPYIKTGNKIYSPGDYKIFKGKYWKKLEVGLTKAKKKVAVASGMIINLNYLIQHYPTFDERLKLYGIDSDFVLEYAKRNEFFFVIDYNLVHSLSLNEEEEVDKKLFRFKHIKHSTRLISLKKSFLHYLLSEAFIFWISIKMFLKYKDRRFFKNILE